jgi:uracil-DNA glycosylase family 4
MAALPIAPDHDCPLCPRLAAFRAENRLKFPDKFNGPVPSFGPLDAKLLIIGLAPGLKGANFSGRPFTGDYAGNLLYPTLKAFGFAKGEYKARPDDGFELVDCRIVNAVRCVPPQNKPLPEEEHTCRVFLKSEFEAMKHVKVILTQGVIAHNTVLRAFGLKMSAYKFKHGQVHALPDDLPRLVDTYHTSRYNVNTGTLTEAMFADVVKLCRTLVDQ